MPHNVNVRNSILLGHTILGEGKKPPGGGTYCTASTPLRVPVYIPTRTVPMPSTPTHIKLSVALMFVFFSRGGEVPRIGNDISLVSYGRKAGHTPCMHAPFINLCSHLRHIP